MARELVRQFWRRYWMLSHPKNYVNFFMAPRYSFHSRAQAWCRRHSSGCIHDYHLLTSSLTVHVSLGMQRRQNNWQISLLGEADEVALRSECHQKQICHGAGDSHVAGEKFGSVADEKLESTRTTFAQGVQTAFAVTRWMFKLFLSFSHRIRSKYGSTGDTYKPIPKVLFLQAYE